MASAALVLEASADGGALKTARKGVSLYDVRVLGRAAHAGLEPERGRQRDPRAGPPGRWPSSALADPARGTTVTPTAACGRHHHQHGPGRGLVRRRRPRPDRRRAGAGRRRHARAAHRSLPGAVARDHGRPQPTAAGGGGVGGAVRARASRSPSGSVCRSRLAAAVGGGSDGNFTAGVGTPTLDGLGAVGGGAHADDEHVLVDELPGRTALLAALVADLLADPTHRLSSTTGAAPTMTDPGSLEHGPADTTDPGRHGARPQAVQAADAAALAAGVTVREVTDLVELEDVVRLFAAIWGRDANPPVTVELLRAFTKAGNYVAGAFDGRGAAGRRLRRLLPRAGRGRPAQPHRRGRARR